MQSINVNQNVIQINKIQIKKIADVNRLVTNTAFNTKVREVEKKKIPDVIRLVTNTALNMQIEKVKKNS